MEIDGTSTEIAPQGGAPQISVTNVEMHIKLGPTTQHSPHQITQSSDDDSTGKVSKSSSRPSQGSLSGSRKFTPIQPVFDDFATAHSSITSGNAKGRIAIRSNVDLSLPRSISSTESETIQKHPLKVTKRSEPPSEELPIPPIPALLKASSSFNSKSGKLDVGHDEKDSFSTRNYEKVSTPRLPSNNAIRSPATPTTAENTKSSGDISHTLKSNTNLRYSAKWSIGSVYSDHSLSSIGRLYSGIVTQSNLLSQRPASHKRAGINASPSFQEAKYQPILFDSPSAPTLEGHIMNDMHDTEGSFANYGEAMEHYYEYDADIGYGGSHEDSDVLFSPFAHRFDDPNQSSSTGSSPQTEGSTVIHVMEHYERGSQDSDGSFYEEDYNSDDDLPLPGQIPTFTRAANGSPMICPSQESIEQYPAVNYGSPAICTGPTSRRPPSMSLPQLPTEPNRAYLQTTTSGVLGKSSSYGDTHNLLDFTKNSPPMNNARRSPHHDMAPRQFFEYDRESAYPPAHFRLERDISLALHCASEDDDPSEKSFVSNRREVDHPSPSSFKSVLQSLRSDQKRFSEIFKDGFYSNLKSAPHIQTRNNREIRIPIGHGVDRATSSGLSHRRVSGLTEMVTQDDDGNDWETIGDSVMLSRPPTHLYSDMAFNETGSSIANFSDHQGESSSGPILGSFASSKQILQHPAQSKDRYEKRSRRMVDTPLSIVLPKSKQYANDGFPMNALRTPKQRRGSLSSSLGPEVSQSPEKDYMQLQDADPDIPSPYSPKRKAPAQKHDSVSTTMDDELPREGGFTGPQSMSRPWIDGSRNLGFSVHDQNSRAQYKLDEGQDRPDSFMQMVLAANDGKIPRFIPPNVETRTVGSSIADASTISSHDEQDTSPVDGYNPYIPQSKSHVSKSCQKDGKEDQSTSRTRAPFFKGPPGAFYESLRSKAGTRHASEIQDDGTPKESPFIVRGSPRRVQSSIDGSPNRHLRPLSLVAEALGPIKPVVVQPKAPQEFQYRSLLAPVKSEAWRRLYSATELDHINSVPLRPDQALARLNGDTVKSNTSWKVHRDAPHMTAWRHENSSLGSNTTHRKAKISYVVLALCCLFPPALALMRVGVLDQFMIWYTKGEISHFGKKQKKIAGYVFAAYAFVAVFVVAIILVFRFLRSAK